MGLPASSTEDLTTERRKYLESLSFTELKKQARASNISIPSNMRKSDRLELIDKLFKK